MEFDFTLPGLGRPESSRPKRVGEAIRNELAILLLQKVQDPRLREVNISEVVVCPDLKRATIHFTLPVGSDVKKALKGLERAKGFFRSHIARCLNLRYTPELVFRYNKQNEHIQHLDELFQQIAREEKTDDESA
jgi:ribosome-binding factor A